VDAIDYLERSEPNRILPTGAVDGTLEALKDHLFLEGGVTATQVPNNLLLASPIGGSSFNTYTVYNYHTSPDFRGELPTGIRYELRSDDAWTRSTSDEANLTNTFYGHDLADLSMLPRPYGGELRIEQTDTNYEDDPAAPPTRQQAGRLTGRMRVDPQLVVGLDVGRERENFVLGDQFTWIRGAELDWRPTDRSDISLSAERRYFGTGFNYAISHRNPWIALNIGGSRNVMTSAQELFTLPATNNVASLLEQLLTTQYPDPVARAQAVQNLMASQGLPGTLAGPAGVFAPNAFLMQSAQASVVVMGIRSSIAFSVFQLRSQPIPETLSGTNLPINLSTDYLQRGASVTFNHHITTFTVFNADARISNFEGADTLSGLSSRQDALTLKLNHALSARTDATLGARYQYFTSSTEPDVREKALFAALTHRF
jgi:uncharacterized protein (PEP-CTERM system associated)